MQHRLRLQQLIVALVLAALTTAGTPVAAQSSARPPGLWLGIEAGHGIVSLPSCSGCGTGGVLYGAVRMGGTPGRRLRLGAEIVLAREDGGSGTPSLAALSAVAIHRLLPSVSVSGGIGIGARGGHSNVDGFLTPAVHAGMTWEVPVGETFTMGPTVSWTAIPFEYPTHLFRIGLSFVLGNR